LSKSKVDTLSWVCSETTNLIDLDLDRFIK